MHLHRFASLRQTCRTWTLGESKWIEVGALRQRLRSSRSSTLAAKSQPRRMKWTMKIVIWWCWTVVKIDALMKMCIATSSNDRPWRCEGPIPKRGLKSWARVAQSRVWLASESIVVRRPRSSTIMWNIRTSQSSASKTFHNRELTVWAKYSVSLAHHTNSIRQTLRKLTIAAELSQASVSRRTTARTIWAMRTLRARTCCLKSSSRWAIIKAGHCQTRKRPWDQTSSWPRPRGISRSLKTRESCCKVIWKIRKSVILPI